MKTKIFVSSYACEPNLGSEIGVGWHWVLEMSRYYELWVLTRESNKKSIEPWIKEHPEYEGIHFMYYDMPKWARWWKKGLRGVRLYYNLWQWRTNMIVEKAMEENGIEIYHHLTYGNALWKTSSYGSKRTFIWGPIGGLETIDADFTKHYTTRWRLIEWVRRTTVKLIPLNLPFKRRCKDADLIICKTEATYNQITEKYRHKAILMTDVAADNTLKPMSDKDENKDNIIRYISIGRLDAWRGFDLTIEAFAKLAAKHDNVELLILGKGSDKERLQTLAANSGCNDKIKFEGQVSHEEYTQKLKETDVVVNAALKEGAVTVMFDSLAMGKPMVCVETGGYTRMLNNDVAEIVKITDRDTVISKLADGMERFFDAENRKQVSVRAAELLEQLDWSHKGIAISNEINKLIK